MGVSRIDVGGGNIIVMYHSIGDPALFGNISVERFRADLEYFDSQFELVDLPSLFDKSSCRRLTVTFDDGYRNVLSNAYPVLKTYDAPATVFLISEFLGSDTETVKETLRMDEIRADTMLNEEDVETIVETDLLTVGNHTRTHPHLSTLDDHADVAIEIQDAQKALESRFGIEVSRFCFPFGDFDERSLDVVATSHDYGVCSINGHVHRQSPRHRLPRVRGHNEKHVLEWETAGLSEPLRRLYELA
jgi:peptidoglycan/xylan/chitin deacetylase (PgdA/CDA1 family)